MPNGTGGLFADRLNALFTAVRPGGGAREYTNSQVAAATGVSASYIGYLRKGVRFNPSVEAVQLLARFFAVRPGYFVDDGPDAGAVGGGVDDELTLIQALRDPGIKRLVMRAAEARLSAGALATIAAMIDEVGKLEQAAERERRAAPPS